MPLEVMISEEISEESKALISVVGMILGGNPHGVVITVLLSLAFEVVYDSVAGDEKLFDKSCDEIIDRFKTAFMLRQADGETKQ